MARAGAPTYGIGTTMMIAWVINVVGTEEQKKEILPKALAGDIVIALGFTEPENGSDAAAAATRAVQSGDGWTINGSKMFTTNAHIADYVFMLARTDPEAPKHRGLTTFLVPMKQDGVEVQPVFTLSGERTNITFYNDVSVPDSYRIGEVDGGWTVMTKALQDEHGAAFGVRIERLLEEAEAWAKESGRISDPDARTRLARVAAEAEVAILLQRRGHWMTETGTVPVAEAPMAKLYSSEALVRASEDLADLMGPDAVRSYFDPTAPRGGYVEHMARFALGTTIYAGTSEVQRNIIAQRGLGLPR